MTLNMGPQHPATHGVLRIVVESDGEIVASCTPDHGYLHRSIEKIGECVEWPMVVPYTDRIDYVCAMNANLAYCVAVEKLLNTDAASAVQVPLRAECIRVLVAELNRISSHMVAVGAMAMDTGAGDTVPARHRAARDRQRHLRAAVRPAPHLQLRDRRRRRLRPVSRRRGRDHAVPRPVRRSRCAASTS
jgi:NADH:ubiquinone oxidoreductase subunit D